MTNELVTIREMNDSQFRFLSNYLSTKYGLRIPVEKKSLLQSRILSRLNHLKVTSIDEYFNYLFKSNNSKVEYEAFVDHITTHKTFFFRENYQFDFVKSILSDYYRSRCANRMLNVWSAGCSTGEEVYTLGMVLHEKKTDLPLLDYRIVGTDVSVPSLRKAAKGRFSTELENLPESFKKKYFQEIDTKRSKELQFNNAEIKSKIQLGVLNLNNRQYNLASQFDFIFCRNVTIYFDAKTRNEVLERIVAKLRPGGYLFLGHSETALGTELPLRSIRPTIYQKINV